MTRKRLENRRGRSGRRAAFSHSATSVVPKGLPASYRRLALEWLESRQLLSASVDLEVLDPRVEPGQEVPIEWRVAQEYVDTDQSGVIERDEAESLAVNIDVLGAIQNQVTVTVSLEENAYIDFNGDLRGFTSVAIPTTVAPGSQYEVYITVDNGVASPIKNKAVQPLSILLAAGDEQFGELALNTTSQTASQTLFPRTELKYDLPGADFYNVMRVDSAAQFPLTVSVYRSYR